MNLRSCGRVPFILFVRWKLRSVQWPTVDNQRCLSLVAWDVSLHGNIFLIPKRLTMLDFNRSVVVTCRQPASTGNDEYDGEGTQWARLCYGPSLLR